MIRIGAHLSGLEAKLLNQLAAANAAASENALRLSTGKQVNAPKDDPAAFLQVSSLESQLSAVNDAVSRVDTAAGIAAQLQLTLDQVRTQLDTVRTALLEDEDGELTSEERAVNQATIDAAIEQIATLAGTQIDGRRMLDGSADFSVSGVNSSQVEDVTVYSVRGGSATISGTVVSAAEQATLTYTGSGGVTTDDAVFTLSGRRGDIDITVAAGASLTDLRDTINQNSHNTGITAEVSGDDLILTSVDYGAEAEVSIDVSSGTFTVTGGDGSGTDFGADATVEINGETMTGTRFTVARNGVHATIEFAAGFYGRLQHRDAFHRQRSAVRPFHRHEQLDARHLERFAHAAWRH